MTARRRFRVAVQWGEAKWYHEATMAEWDATSTSRREVLYLGSDEGVVFVVRED